MNALIQNLKPQTHDPVDAMLTLIECLENDMEVPEDIQAWHLQSLKRYRSGHAASMEEAFGLAVGRGEGRRRLPYIWRERERNALIREAAWQLRKEYPKTQLALVIAHSMQKNIPNVENREARILLAKLRNICMTPRGDKPLEVGKRRVLEIINGAGL